MKRAARPADVTAREVRDIAGAVAAREAQDIAGDVALGVATEAVAEQLRRRDIRRRNAVAYAVFMVGLICLWALYLLASTTEPRR